jgi:hypothetical protein
MAGAIALTQALQNVAALGDDEAAWQRLAASPATYAGPTVWLRLGDILDAARSGGDWPAPPLVEKTHPANAQPLRNAID